MKGVTIAGVAGLLSALVCATPAHAAGKVPGLVETQRLPMPFYGSVVVPEPDSGRAPGVVLRVSQTCRVLPLAPTRRLELQRRPDRVIAGCGGTSALAGRPVVADLDADGIADVAIPDAGGRPAPGRTFVAFGRPDGGFDPPLRLPTSFQPRTAAAGDVDGDGRRDLIVASDGRRTTGGPDAPPEVTVFTQRAPREFAARATFVPRADTYRILPVDADRDGRLDLIVGSSAGVELRLGAGDGTFPAGKLLLKGGNAALRLADADADGDERLDLLALGYDGSVTLIPGTRRGFGTPHTVRRASDAFEVSAVMAVADLDRKARPEVVLVSEDDLRVFRFGARGRLEQVLVLPTAYDPRNLEVLDTDRDGRAEALVVADPHSLRLVVVRRPGLASRPVLRAPAAPTVAADRSAHLALGCTRGIGPCRGRATIAQGGRRLGTAWFDIPPGARTDVRVPLSRVPAGTRAIARLRTRSARIVRSVALRPATARERRRACRVGHGIARRGGGRLFYPPQDDTESEPVGCLDAVGAWFPLPVDVLREPLAVFGRFAVFHHELCDDSCLPRLGLVDIRRRTNLGGVDVFMCPPRCNGESDIPALAVGARGGFAWVTCALDDRRRHCSGSWTLHVLDGRGRRRAHSGTDLRSPRLRVERGGRTVVLTGGGTRRAVRLRGAPRRGPGGLEPDPF